MSLRLSEHPERDRPRERLWSVGPAALTGQELLAILLGTGCAGRDALAVAGELLARVDGSLRPARRSALADLARVPGVGRGKRLAWWRARAGGAGWEPRRSHPRSGSAVRRTCSGFYASRLRISRWRNFTCCPRQPESGAGRSPHHAGDLNSSLVHPREVFRAAIAEAAAGIIVVHNHPSGDATPSADDRAVTRQLVTRGPAADLPVYDHVIVGGDRYVRLR